MARDGVSAYGPGWADVGQVLRVLSRKWGGSWTISVRSAPRLGYPDRLSVVCARRTGDGENRDIRECYVGHEYPSREYATMPQLMHELCYRLDSKLENDKVKREGQTSF